MLGRRVGLWSRVVLWSMLLFRVNLVNKSLLLLLLCWGVQTNYYYYYRLTVTCPLDSGTNWNRSHCKGTNIGGGNQCVIQPQTHTKRLVGFTALHDDDNNNRGPRTKKPKEKMSNQNKSCS